MKGITINKVAVLGAGVMGAQIAAHFVNVGIPVILFDLAGSDDDPYFIVRESISSLSSLRPNPLVNNFLTKHITPANYNSDLNLLNNCDLVIESIAERYNWKINLYKKIAPYLCQTAILVTNTSGLSISKLAKNLSSELKLRFLGMHFFNPPRYMKLIELIPHENTNKTLLDNLEEFIVTNLGKSVVRAKDTPNFIGNRIGVFFTIIIIHHAEKLGLPPDMVDNLTGCIIGRPKTATYKTLDIIGLDVFAQTVSTMRDELTTDPWCRYFELPEWLNGLINRGLLGVKAKGGIYKKVSGRMVVFDRNINSYRPIMDQPSSEIREIFALKDPYLWFCRLKNSRSKEATLLWNSIRDLLHYCAFHLHSIANNMADVDLALKWGYGWQAGPFETWKMAGWHEVLKLLHHDMTSNNTTVKNNLAPLPEWVFKFGEQQNKSTMELPVYKKQLFKDSLTGDLQHEGTTILENKLLRLWTLDKKIAILSFKTKHNLITSDLIEALPEAITKSETYYSGLIIWQREGRNFCTGFDVNNFNLTAELINKLQQINFQIKSAAIPVITAVFGKCVWAGCEFALYSDRTIAALETYIGFNKLATNIKLPFGGGLTEIVRRCSRLANLYEASIDNFLKSYCMTITKKDISTSSKDNLAKLYLKSADIILPNKDELLFAAHQEIRSLIRNNYRPSINIKSKIEVGGTKTFIKLENMLKEMLDTEQIYEPAFAVGVHLARVLSGGDVVQWTEVSIARLLKLEKQVVLELYSDANKP